MSNTALALNRCLLNPALTANRTIFISDFATSQSELVSVIAQVSGEKWTVKSFDFREATKDYQKRFEEGDPMAVYKLIEIGFVTGRYGGWLEENEELWNRTLGLPKAKIEDVVFDALEKMKQTN